MKCTRHLCHEAPCSTASMAPLRSWWTPLVTSLAPKTTGYQRARMNESQKEPSLLGPTSNHKHLPLTGTSLHSHGNHNRHGANSPVLTSLEVGSIEPHVRIRTFQYPVAETLELLL